MERNLDKGFIYNYIADITSLLIIIPMKIFIITPIFIFLLIINSFGQYHSSYFNGGIQFGMALNTIYKYTDGLGYFDKLNYGKKVTGTIGVYINRQLRRNINFETGLFYYKRGTRYNTRPFCINYSDEFNLHYIGFPVVIYQKKKNIRSSIAYRYGFDVAYNFASDGIANTYNDYDLSGVLGIKLNPKGGNNRMVIDFKFSILPIVDLNYADLLGTIEGFNILPNQRNFSITISIQHDFNFT